MELRHLKYFVAVAEEQNITRAAARLHVSQPPLSRQIRDLETELGVLLFERVRPAVRLTPAGWAFLEESYAVLRQAEHAVQAARAAAGGKTVFKLGYAPGPTQEFLRELLRRLREQRPELRVELHDLTTAEMIAGLRAGQLEAALMVQPQRDALHGLRFEKLQDDETVAVMAHDHRLAKRKHLATTELAAESWVIFSRKEYPEHYDGIVALLGGKNARPKIAVECDSGMSLFAALEDGQGISILSRALAAAIGNRLKQIPLRPAQPPQVTGIGYPAKAPSARLEFILEQARAVARA